MQGAAEAGKSLDTSAEALQSSLCRERHHCQRVNAQNVANCIAKVVHVSLNLILSAQHAVWCSKERQKWRTLSTTQTTMYRRKTTRGLHLASGKPARKATQIAPTQRSAGNVARSSTSTLRRSLDLLDSDKLRTNSLPKVSTTP